MNLSLNAYTSKSGKRVTVSAKKAEQFMRMADNWQNNADRSGSGDDYATAAKQALVAAFYAKHSGDAVAAREYYNNAESLVFEAKARGGASKRTLQWILKHKGPTAALVKKASLDGYSGFSGIKLSHALIGLSILGALTAIAIGRIGAE